MKSFMIPVRNLALIITLALFGLACQEYDPPPEILSSTPSNGQVVADYGVDFSVRFTEPINQDTLKVTVSPRKLDAEGELLPWCQGGEGENAGCAPNLSGECTPRTGCHGARIRVDQDLAGFTLDLNQDLCIGKFILRIWEGLEDLEGNPTGVYYDIPFSVSPVGTLGPTTFESGSFLVFMDLEDPFVFKFEVYFHILVDQETGEIIGGGCDAQLIDEEADRVLDPSLRTPEYDFENGYKFVFTGGLVQDVTVPDENGVMQDCYYFENKPTYIYCHEPQVEIYDGTFAATICYREDLQRWYMNGTFITPELYIFDTPAHASPMVGVGTMEGIRLYDDEVLGGEAWQGCAETDPASITCPLNGCP